jgi:uncharacterized protein YndB with AHSA1/START domain
MTTGGGRGYTIVRRFDATPEMVWAAWTTPEHFGAWFGTGAVEMRDVRLDVRPGGAWSGTMIYEGNEIGWHGSYSEVDEPRRLVLTITDGTGGPDEFDVFTVTIEPVEGGTEMSLSQTGGHLTDEEYEQARIGTDSFLDTMESLFGTTIVKSRHDQV